MTSPISKPFASNPSFSIVSSTARAAAQPLDCHQMCRRDLQEDGIYNARFPTTPDIGRPPPILFPTRLNRDQYRSVPWQTFCRYDQFLIEFRQQLKQFRAHHTAHVNMTQIPGGYIVTTFPLNGFKKYCSNLIRWAVTSE